jgi:hypothetical protein
MPLLGPFWYIMLFHYRGTVRPFSLEASRIYSLLSQFFRLFFLVKFQSRLEFIFVEKYWATSSHWPEVELRFCPRLLLFKLWTCGSDPTSSLCLLHMYLWLMDGRELWFWPMESCLLYGDIQRRMSQHRKKERRRKIECLFIIFWYSTWLLYSSCVALFIERGCLSETEIGEREIYMHSSVCRTRTVARASPSPSPTRDKKAGLVYPACPPPPLLPMSKN